MAPMVAALQGVRKRRISKLPWKEPSPTGHVDTGRAMAQRFLHKLGVKYVAEQRVCSEHSLRPVDDGKTLAGLTQVS